MIVQTLLLLNFLSQFAVGASSSDSGNDNAKKSVTEMLEEGQGRQASSIQELNPVFINLHEGRKTLTPPSEIGMSDMSQLLQDAYSKKNTYKLARLQLGIYNRTKDLVAIQTAYRFRANVYDFPAVPEAQEIAKNLCIVKGIPFHFDKNVSKDPETQYIWLPVGDEDDGQLLLERFDPRTVAAFVGQNLSIFRTMFFPHLLAQYILPVFRKENGMTAKMVEPYKPLMKSMCFLQYFHYLFRAFHLHKGAPNHSSHYLNSLQFFTSIGLDKAKFNLCRNHQEKWNQKEYRSEAEMWGILRVAQHWGLNWKNIAETTKQWCELSKRIMNGEIPDGLNPEAPITPHDVFQVAFCKDPTIKRPAYTIENGLVVLKEIGEKRSRNYKTEEERKQTKTTKRRKINHDEVQPTQTKPNQQVFAGSFNEYLAIRSAQGAPQAGFLSHYAFLTPPAMNQLPPPIVRSTGSQHNEPEEYLMDKGRDHHKVLANALAQKKVSRLPPMALNHAAFLAPPQRIFAVPLPATNVPLQPLKKAPQVTLQISKSLVFQSAGQPEHMIVGCKFLGTPEQAEVFYLSCLKAGNAIAGLHGVNFYAEHPSGVSIPISREDLEIPKSTASNEEQQQVPPQENQQQQSMIIEPDRAPHIQLPPESPTPAIRN